MRRIFPVCSLLLSLAVAACADPQPQVFPLAAPAAWTLFCPESLDGADLGALTRIPDDLCGAKGRTVTFTDNAYEVDRAVTKSGPAVFMCGFDAPADGFMQAGCGADWFWEVKVNGATVYDRLKPGNGTSPITPRNHAFYFPVKKGRNLLVATVFRGANGWKFAYGPVPLSLDEKGILREANLVETDLVLTYPDGTKVSQAAALAGINWSGTGKNMRLAGVIADGVTLSLETKEERNALGDYTVALRYVLESDTPFKFDRAQAVLRFPAAAFANGSVVFGKNEIVLPGKPGRPVIASDPAAGEKTIALANTATQLAIKVPKAAATLTDGRGDGHDAFDLRLEVPDVKSKKRAELTFSITPGAPPYKIGAGKDWVTLPFAREIVPGSILDFSFLADAQAPAGRLGRVIIGKDGHFEYEKTGARAKLVGANLCFSANYPPKEDCDALAQVFRRQGYNAVRFHHTDVHMIKGDWNARNSYEINPEMMDKFDYLFAAMKKAGMYVTVDFYTMRYFGPGEIAGVDKRISGEIKALLPISDSAFQAWSKLVVQWMNHVNPYTGLAWKDDPALVAACPLNEDTLFSVLKDDSALMADYLARYAAWKTANGITGPDADPIRKDPRFARFLTEVKRESNRRIAAFLKANQIGVPLSGSNWWNSMAQTFTRSELDVVDNHQYSDHPFNNNYNQNNCVKGDPIGRLVPSFMMPTRIFGKPFTVTEFNYCFPNRYRAEAGAMFGAYSALQDWDAVFRFAWSHRREKNLEPQPISGFDVASDPLSLLADRQIALLFVRGDVSPAIRRYVYAVTMAEATRDGCGGMWAGGLFPADFSAVGLVSGIGSQSVENGAAISGRFDGVMAADAPGAAILNGNAFIPPAELPALVRRNQAGEVVSDTGEIRFNNQLGYLKVVTPRTECLLSYPDRDLGGASLAIRNSSTFASVSASAMDGRPLAGSRRVLVLHLTNVLNSNIKFSTPEMRRVEDWGNLPHLVRAGSVEVSLKNANPDLTLYAVDCSGKRIREVRAAYRDGAYQFTAAIGRAGEEPVMAYELAAAETRN